jgi:hypothetical protein
MNTLQPKTPENQDFSPIQHPRSGLIYHLLNTLRKSAGEGEYPKSGLLPPPRQTATVDYRT